MRDNASKLGSVFPGLPLPANTASVNGAGVDLSAYNAATVYILAGTWTDGTHAFTIQESPDNATWNNVAATDLSHLFTAGANGVVVSAPGAQPASIISAPTAINQRIGYLGGQRWLRVITTVAGTTTGAKYAVLIVAGEPRVFPAAV